MNGHECNSDQARIYFCAFCKIEFDKEYYKHGKYLAYLTVATANNF